MRIIRTPPWPVVPPHPIFRPPKRKSSLPKPLTFRQFTRGLFNKRG
jgi:hypothetical protein